MVKVPGTLWLEIDPSAMPAGPAGPAGGVVQRMVVDSLTSGAAPSASGQAVLTGRELTTIGTTLIVNGAFDVQITRANGAIAADLEVQERVWDGLVWGAWTAIRTMRGFFNGPQAASIDIRGSRSFIYSRSITPGMKVQYRVVSAGMSTNPAAGMVVYPGGSMVYTEVT